MHQDTKTKWLPVLALLPLVIGTIGYTISGEMFSDAYNLCIEIVR